MPWSSATLEERRFDALRLLRQVPAITEIVEADASGREQLRVSELDLDRLGGGADITNDPAFSEAMAHKVYYGPVYFHNKSEPFMTLALAGARRDAGVTIAQMNLKFINDALSKIKVGGHARAYVVDAAGRLIAHPDVNLVLRKTDMSALAQVCGARQAGDASAEQVQEADDLAGHKVLTAYAPVAPLGWFVFVETPAAEAYAPLYTSIQRTWLVLLGALLLAFVAGMALAGRMVVPIQALRERQRLRSNSFEGRSHNRSRLSPTSDNLARYSLPAFFNVYCYVTQLQFHAVPVVTYHIPIDHGCVSFG